MTLFAAYRSKVADPVTAPEPFACRCKQPGKQLDRGAALALFAARPWDGKSSGLPPAQPRSPKLARAYNAIALFRPSITGKNPLGDTGGSLTGLDPNRIVAVAVGGVMTVGGACHVTAVRAIPNRIGRDALRGAFIAAWPEDPIVSDTVAVLDAKAFSAIIESWKHSRLALPRAVVIVIASALDLFAVEPAKEMR